MTPTKMWRESTWREHIDAALTNLKSAEIGPGVAVVRLRAAIKHLESAIVMISAEDKPKEIFCMCGRRYANLGWGAQCPNCGLRDIEPYYDATRED